MELNFLTSKFYHWFIEMTIDLLFAEYSPKQYFKIWINYQLR